MKTSWKVIAPDMESIGFAMHKKMFEIYPDTFESFVKDGQTPKDVANDEW